MRAVKAPPELVMSGGDGVVRLSSSSNMELEPVTDMLSFSMRSSLRELVGCRDGLTRLSLTSRSGSLVSGVGSEDELFGD